jgi:broad specificity phosphatase PhoE
MSKVAAALIDEQFDVVITSKLRRTLVAAGVIAPNVRLISIEGFNEINFGEWEGLTRDEIRMRDPVAYAQWCERVHEFVYPSGDSVGAFRSRVVATFRQLLPEMPERTLIVAHKGVISAIVANLLELTPEQRLQWAVDLASVHVLERSTHGWRAGVINRTDHLGEK